MTTMLKFAIDYTMNTCVFSFSFHTYTVILNIMNTCVFYFYYLLLVDHINHLLNVRSCHQCFWTSPALDNYL